MSPDEQILYDVVIVGGGPAGLTAALYTSRAKLKTMLIDSVSILGQVAMTEHIENYPGFPGGISGLDMLDKFKEQAGVFGTEFLDGNVKKIEEHTIRGYKAKRLWVDNKEYHALAVIVAAGAAPRMVGVPGEKEFRGRGVSYCATCDGPFFKNKSIVVVGGGDTAVQEACFLTSFAKKVTLIHRRDRLRAVKILQERAFANEKIDFIWDSNITEIRGKAKVEGVKVINKKTQEESELASEGVFIFIGFIPNTDFLKGMVDLDEEGYLIEDIAMKTSAPGLFVCGDCRQASFRQIITACGDGATAALSAQYYVEDLKGVAYK